MRLFVAAVLPNEVCTALIAARPAAAPGVRVVPPDHLHLTLHFLGDRELGPCADALAAVRAEPLPLTIDGLGTFGARDGSVTLWARVVPTPALDALHAAVGGALAPLGFVPEARAYTPHVTLARYAAARDVRAHVLDTHVVVAGVVTSFALWSSTPGDAAPTYRIERAYPAR